MAVCQFIPVLCVLGAPYGAPNTHKQELPGKLEKWERGPTEDPDSLVKNGFLTPEDGTDRLPRNVGKELRLLAA